MRCEVNGSQTDVTAMTLNSQYLPARQGLSSLLVAVSPRHSTKLKPRPVRITNRSGMRATTPSRRRPAGMICSFRVHIFAHFLAFLFDMASYAGPAHAHVFDHNFGKAGLTFSHIFGPFLGRLTATLIQHLEFFFL